tara:strand:- start:218 stop:2506 length:2289 start_codon:yes stop_codon:yes gene_type:complete
MALFDFMRQKEVATEQLGDFYATSVKAPQVSPIGRRPSMTDLAARYGMLVHRCVAINATTAASIQPRLFAIGNAATLTKARGLHPKPLDAQTKDFMRGRMSVAPSASVVRKIKGNLDNIVELESHPVLDLFDDVNDHQEGIGFREGFYSDLQIFGRNFTLLVRDGSKQPTSMWRLLPQMMNVVPGKEQFLSHFEYGGGSDKVRYETDDVFWVRVYDPSDPYGGVGPLEAWLQTIDAQFGNAAFIENMYRRGGSPDYVLMAKGGMSEAQKRSFRSEFRRLFGRMVNRQDTIAILSGEAELKPLQRAPRDLQTVEQEKYTIEALAIAFGVPKSLLTTDDVNLANAREGSITHARNTILPMLRRFEDAVNQRLLPLWSDRLFLMHDNPVREDREIRINERPSQLAAGYTVNEIRLADDLEPLDMPAADTPMIASNLIPLGAPQVGQQEAEMIEESKSITIDEPCCKEHADDSSFDELMDVANYKAWPGIEEEWSTEYDRGLQRIYAKILKQAAKAVKKSAAPWVVKDRPLEIGDNTLIMAELDLDGFSAEMYDISHKNIKSAVGESGRAAMVELGERVPGVEIAFDIDNSSTLAAVKRSSTRIAKRESVEVAKTIRREVGKNIKLGGTVAELSKRFQEMAMAKEASWSSHKANMVARTETMIAKNEGRNDAWKQSGVVKGKKFLIAPGACPICEAVNKQMGGQIDLDATINGNIDTITYGGGKTYNFGTYRPFTTPPVHPNCRCTLEPVTFSTDEIADMLMSEDD